MALTGLAGQLAVTPAASDFEFVAPPDRQGRLRVVSFTARESMSELYSFEVMLCMPRAHDLPPADLEESLLGQPGHLTLGVGEPMERTVRGIVSSVVLEGTSAENRRPCVRLTLVPRLWLTTQKRRSRIFQEMTVREVIDKVLDEWAIPRTWRTLEKMVRRTYCTQYQETDHAFITRLLAEEGIFFYFTAPPRDDERKTSGQTANETDLLVLCDHESGYAPVPSLGTSERPSFTFAVDHGHRIVDDTAVLDFALRGTVRPNAVLLSGYDADRPSYRLRAGAQLRGPDENEDAGKQSENATLTAGFLGVHDHHPRARYESDPEKAQVDSQRARTALEQLRRDVSIGEGKSGNWRLAPGHTFRLEGHPMSEVDGDYVVTEVEQTGYVQSMLDKQVDEIYRNRFRCTPAEAPYRPPVPPRRMAQVAETATVVGTGAEEIVTDRTGRIRVRFHWDLDEAEDGRSSCWIRLAQPWAGMAHGSQFIPRVGNEVLVTFLRGDPDDPVVTGSLYNGVNGTAFLLPEAKSRSGIRTASTPAGSGGYNELAFEDRAGAEEIHVHAERDLTEEIGHDHVAHVGHFESLVVDQGRSTVVTLADLETVLGAKVSTIALGRIDTIGVEHRSTVAGPKVETVIGCDSRELREDQSVTVKGNRSVWVDGFLSTRVGTKQAPSEALTTVQGHHTTHATRCLRIASEEQIVLECGNSRLVIGPDEVTIHTPRLMVKGTESVEIEANGPVLKLTDEASLSAQMVKLTSQGASLELTATADINGAKINLGCGGGAMNRSAADESDPETRPVELKLHDDEMRPFAGKKYRLMAGGKKLEGTTGEDGSVRGRVPVEAKVAQLTLWIDEYPTGPTLEWPIDLSDKDTPPVKSAAGALQRLRDLGYHAGEIATELTAEAEAALRVFQSDNGLEPTGALDAKTIAKIEEVHGV